MKEAWKVLVLRNISLSRAEMMEAFKYIKCSYTDKKKNFAFVLSVRHQVISLICKKECLEWILGFFF